MRNYLKFPAILAAVTLAFTGMAPAGAQSSLSSSSAALNPTPTQPDSWNDPQYGEQRVELHQTITTTMASWGWTTEEPFNTHSQKFAEILASGMTGMAPGMSQVIKEYGGQFAIDKYNNTELDAVIAEYKEDETTPSEPSNRPVGLGVAGNAEETIVVAYIPDYPLR